MEQGRGAVSGPREGVQGHFCCPSSGVAGKKPAGGRKNRCHRNSELRPRGGPCVPPTCRSRCKPPSRLLPVRPQGSSASPVDRRAFTGRRQVVLGVPGHRRPASDRRRCFRRRDRGSARCSLRSLYAALASHRPSLRLRPVRGMPGGTPLMPGSEPKAASLDPEAADGSDERLRVRAGRSHDPDVLGVLFQLAPDGPREP